MREMQFHLHGMIPKNRVLDGAGLVSKGLWDWHEWDGCMVSTGLDCRWGRQEI